jgi:hypothetical protein
MTAYEFRPHWSEDTRDLARSMQHCLDRLDEVPLRDAIELSSQTTLYLIDRIANETYLTGLATAALVQAGTACQQGLFAFTEGRRNGTN